MLSRAIHPFRRALFAAALLAAACAGNQKRNPSTDVHDAAVATAPAPTRAEPAPQCRADADCGPGQACSSGQCIAASRCDLLRVSFAFDSAQLDERAMQSLRDDAQCLKQRRAAALLVEGHCDERGTTAYNIALGARRAEAVKRYLADLGIGARIETVSFGKELPAVQGTGEAAWAKNRRAELKAQGDTRSDGKPVSL
ncbi:MAG TPA: OmpA family protein [Anaeromyxobacter sp.]|nr:OmpA family protein [Anaeromyxobacter sp.]